MNGVGYPMQDLRCRVSRIRSRTHMNNFGISHLLVEQCSPGGEISLQSLKASGLPGRLRGVSKPYPEAP
jgi:hypothetical protein